MPAATAEIKARVAPELKEKAREVYSHWGLNLNDAINVFLVKSVEVGGLPFDMRPGGFDLSGVDVIRPRRIDGQTVLPAFMNDDEEDLYDDLV